VAADVDQQRGVVDDRTLLLIQPTRLGQPHGDQALAQDVLHRLVEAEVDAERERRHQLGEPDVCTVGLTCRTRSHVPPTDKVGR
jgi:hypothetical protein